MEEGLCLCHCKISNSIKENECLLEKAIEAYSDMISKQENHPYSFAENNVCENCRQNGEQMGTRRALSFAYNERGQLKYLLVNFDGAVQDYTKAITLHPNAIALYNRGQIYYRMGMFSFIIFVQDLPTFVINLLNSPQCSCQHQKL